MANAITAFKDRYTGQPTKIDKLSSNAEADLAKAYKDAYNAIWAIMAEGRKDTNYATYAKQKELMKGIAAELQGMKRIGGDVIEATLKAISEYSTRVAIKDLDVLGTGITKSEEWHYKYNGDYVNNVFKDTFIHVAAQTDKMKADSQRMLREDAALISRKAAVEGWSRAKATKELQSTLLSKDPNFKFVDKAGRNWETKNYLTMLMRTTMLNTQRECYINTLAAEGQDLVIVSDHGTVCHLCKPWEGQVLSLTGASKDYPTLEDAIVDGLFHPNCQHILIAYHPDVEEAFDKIAKGEEIDLTLPEESLEGLAATSMSTDDLLNAYETITNEYNQEAKMLFGRKKSINGEMDVILNAYRKNGLSEAEVFSSSRNNVKYRLLLNEYSEINRRLVTLSEKQGYSFMSMMKQPEGGVIKPEITIIEGGKNGGFGKKTMLEIAKNIQTVLDIQRNEGFGKVAIKVFRTRKRAHYDDKGGIFLPNGDLGTTVHELAHLLEDKNGRISTACRNFLDKRTKGENLVRLNDIVSGNHYNESEKTRADKFFNPYVGKHYSNGATEVFSMGLEKILTDPIGFLKADRGHFKFIVDILRGKYGS
jgi:hypothetical protein